MPRISVIVPLYNTEAYCGECLQSLLNQSSGDFEVICVNDGSTDKSFEIAKKTAGSDERFIFLEQENGGLSAARNTGLRAAAGDYVCFLDSDDCLAPHALETLFERAAAEALDVLDFSAQTFYDTEAARRAHEEDYAFRTSIEGILTGPELFVRYWETNSYVSSACLHLIRREFLLEQSLCFKKGILHEDELFTPLLYPFAKRTAFLNEPLYLRRMRTGSIMTAGRGIKNVESLHIIVRDLRSWIDTNAQDFSSDFLKTFTRNIGILQATMTIDAASISEHDLDSFLASLSPGEKIDFLIQFSFGVDMMLRAGGAPEPGFRSIFRNGANRLMGRLSLSGRK